MSMKPKEDMKKCICGNVDCKIHINGVVDSIHAVPSQVLDGETCDMPMGTRRKFNCMESKPCPFHKVETPQVDFKPVSNCCGYPYKLTDKGRIVCTKCEKEIDIKDNMQLAKVETLKPESWEMEFSDLLEYYNRYYSNHRDRNKSKAGRNKLKFFISNLLTSEREKVIKEVEGMEKKLPKGEVSYFTHTMVQGYNQALSDVLLVLKGKK